MIPEQPTQNENWLKAVNSYIGARIRQRRKQLSMSQTQLGVRIDLTFQQVQKYEQGNNRIGAARLLNVSQILDVHPMYFLSDAPSPPSEPANFPVGAGMRETQAPLAPTETQHEQQIRNLLESFGRIEDASVRQHVLAVVAALANG